ncbi:MAG TPA: hypothetical protein VGD90_03705 [Sphingobacteriaceae bacterium]
MIAVIYSGSRYAEWRLANKGQLIASFQTPGINPFLHDEKYILNILNKNDALITYAERIKRIYFYGAGVSSKERNEIIANVFANFFRFSKITIDHDMKAAALACCGDEPGIVGIIGSGSNACYFDGKKLKLNNYGLGFVLADEGSANWLGKQLLKSFLNETLPATLAENLKSKYGLDRKQVLDKVYRQPQPALFLSSFADFLMENRQEEWVDEQVRKGFQRYCSSYLIPLAAQYPNSSVYVVGSVADGFGDLLRETAYKNNLLISSIIKEPIHNVLNYYSDKN